ncbi:MAG: ATP-binding protein [Hymenobacteraceae bacterium]|nr:ATP-binding protein [Hymenobacteraceae bacterium]MDX5397485.1 ATP-binding protein [Hymenobacteraceae bacterium]MDX5444147.1 ATP-binding protein [Hymenobacteraceae bacterium]MDX5513561.1 ATP-binding protein [Hymenobacteraceae bacterium]
MVYNNFRRQLLWRLVLVFATGFAVMFLLLKTNYKVAPFLGTALTVILIAELVRYLEKMKRDVSSLLLSVKHHDYTKTYSENAPEKSRDPIRVALNDLVLEFQRLRSDKESHYQYLQTVVEHVGIALLCYSHQNQVELMNQAAKDLFRKPYLKNIDALAAVDEHLLETVKKLESGERELIKVEAGGELLNLSVLATEFKLQGVYYKLVSFQNIKSELDEQEIASWQKLIRVLTHEITNSVMPISSLATVVNNMLVGPDGEQIDLNEIDEEDVADIRMSLKTIERRSKGLLSFVKSYRNLTQVSSPNFRDVSVEELFERVAGLLRPELDKTHVQLETVNHNKNLTVKADLELVEQILINLILNARDALQEREGNRLVELIAASPDPQKVLIHVKDNGSGIDPEVLENIFVPFYTTKKTGSGIGLSLSRQIMRLHKGSISVKSVVGEGTVFTLSF